MEVNVDAKAVEQAVSDAIIKSALGVKIEKAVHELLNKTFDNPIDKALADVVKEIAVKKIREQYSDKIEVFLKEKMTDEALSKVADKFWKSMYEFDR